MNDKGNTSHSHISLSFFFSSSLCVSFFLSPLCLSETHSFPDTSDQETENNASSHNDNNSSDCPALATAQANATTADGGGVGGIPPPPPPQLVNGVPAAPSMDLMAMLAVGN